tara:strand:- start:9579 stop:9770 length:192 start_codon:yes stop_codon:yes gene_type:complete
MEPDFLRLISSLPPLPQEELDRQERAAERLRERHCTQAFYRERDKRLGMNCWRHMQSSAALAD